MKKQLKDFCTFYNGTGFPIKYQGNSKDKYPFYKVGDISKNVQNGYKILTCCDNFISDEIVKTIRGTIVPEGSIVFAKIGEAVKLNRRAITSSSCLVDNNVIAIKPDEKQIDLDYFYYFMKSIDMAQYSNSTTVPSVKKSVLELIDLDVPTFEEQIKRKSILNSITDSINIKNKILNELNKAIQSEFVEMFGEPIVENGKPFSECFEMNPKKTEITNWADDLEVSFLSMSCISENGDINTSVIKKYSEVKKGFTYFRENDVLFAKITPCMENGKGGIAKKLRNGVGFGSTEFHVLRPIDNVSNPYWIYYLTSFNSFRTFAEKKMTGSAGQKRVPVSFFDIVKVNLPSIELQERFAAFVQQIDKSKFVVKQQIADLQELLDSKMQEYFS